MRLSDYIQGLRKGKEAHRLEKESMKDPFLADAIDGYNQVEGNHEQRIEQLRIQISARSTKKRNTYAIIWSVAACLVIGFGISSYFLFLKETPEPVIPIIPQKEIALVPTKTKTDSTPISPVSTKQAEKKDIIAKSRTTISKPPSAPITTPIIAMIAPNHPSTPLLKIPINTAKIPSTNDATPIFSSSLCFSFFDF